MLGAEHVIKMTLERHNSLPTNSHNSPILNYEVSQTEDGGEEDVNDVEDSTKDSKNKKYMTDEELMIDETESDEEVNEESDENNEETTNKDFAGSGENPEILEETTEIVLDNERDMPVLGKDF